MLTNEQLEAKLASLRAKEKLMRGLAFCAFALLFISGVVTGNVLVFLFFFGNHDSNCLFLDEGKQ